MGWWVGGLVYLLGLAVVTDTDDRDLGELDKTNELLHPSSILSTHPIHLVHDHQAFGVGGGGGEGGGESRVVQHVT